MDFTTKYDIGQVVYYINSNKIISVTIASITATISKSAQAGKTYEIIYKYEDSRGSTYYDSNLYPTQELALRTLLSPDDFDKIVKEISGRTIDTWKNKE